MVLNMDDEYEGTSEGLSKVIDEVSKIVIGKEELIKLLMIALLCEGHVLVEGMPGTAKTLLARAFSRAVGGEFKRIQFTSDTLPSDITGFYLYTVAGKGSLIKGPVFSNILLADELNRGPPRTQAALLEAMQDRTVSIESETFSLPRPFMVIATQVPYGSAGTYPLPDVQLDRFMFRIWSGYNPREVEEEVVKKIDFIDELPVKKVIDIDILINGIDMVKKVTVDDKIVEYIINLVEKIRSDENILSGPSTRGIIGLYKGARASAFLSGRRYVIPDDVKMLIHPALDHRVRVKAEAVIEGINPEDIIEKAAKEVPIPK